MDQIDLAAMLLTALLALPGEWWAMAQANPGPWLIVAAFIAVVVALKMLELRLGRRRRRSR